ncbi:hypothetical protein E3O44_16670 [Cryobacterium algoricola]|uniref:GtrA family protein n=1 Tax=Cryobacterium algoricola TaxID=1259183 RepID=A0ABY2IB80_9MICO|nr:hypothetical protein [Cryobacterium algoricola]TFB84112.1 hypothetical protein E3O44_16670 [Cryobacterium algoricola]
MIRLRKTRWKVAYILVGVIALAAIEIAIQPLMILNPMSAVVANSLTVLLYFGGVRSFRGVGEPIEPPRAWWRMTSRPRAGYIIGSLLVLSSANGVLVAMTGPPELILNVAISVAVDASLAFLYFRSSTRLRKAPPRTVQEVPRWKPLKS